MSEKALAILKIISILIVVMILLKFCLIFLKPFIISILVVIFIEPVVVYFNRFLLSRKISVWVSIIAIVVCFLIPLYYITKYTFEQMINFLSNLPDVINILSNSFGFLGNKDYSRIINTIQSIINAQNSHIVNTLISTASGIIDIIIIFMTTLFLSMDFNNFKAFLKKFLPFELYTAISNVNHKIYNILRIELKLILITTLLTIFGLWILGVERPLTIGLICGILDMLPVVGTSLIFVPWVIYSLIIKRYSFAIGMIFLFLLLIISRQFMEVKFMGVNLKIHPVTAIFSLYVGFLIFGIWGVIFGPFIIVLAKELLENTYDFRRGLRR